LKRAVSIDSTGKKFVGICKLASKICQAKDDTTCLKLNKAKVNKKGEVEAFTTKSGSRV
jgi:hypothetical protein